MAEITVQIAILLGLTLVSAFFAMSEIAVVSARKTRLQQRAEEGDRGSAAALALASDPDRFLSTVQVGITLIGILAGAYGGATLAEELSNQLAGVQWLGPYREAISLGIVVSVLTFVTLVLGELVPKRLALVNPEGIASGVARFMQGLSMIAAPVVALLSASSGLVVRLLRVNANAEPPVSEEEIKIMLEQGTQAGVFEPAEQDIVERVFRLRDRTVKSLMTPRTDIVWIDIDDPIGDSMRTMTTGGHSYYPVCKGSVETVVGMASVKDQWARMVNKQSPDIKACLQPPLYVPETTPALQILETFKKAGRHVAMVIDEYGGINGLVTLNNVLEAIVGDIPVGEGPEDRPAVQRADGSWLLDGMLPIGELKEVLEIDELPDEDRGEFHTLGGFMMMQLGRIPHVTDRVECAGMRFEIVDMDGHRVDKVIAEKLPEAPEVASDGSV